MTGVTTSEHYLGLSVFPTSPYYARVHVQRVLEGWRRDDLIETAQLVVSELVSNAIKAHASFFAATEATAHASPDHIWMDLYRADETVVLRVWDAGRTPPVLRNPDPDDEGGRGLYLVDLIAKEWGYYWPASGGKIVWCALAAPPPPGRERNDRRRGGGPRPGGSVPRGGRRDLLRDGPELPFERVDECPGRLAQPCPAGTQVFGEPPGRRPHPHRLTGELVVGGVERGLQDGDPRLDLRQRLFQHLTPRVGHQILRMRTHKPLFGRGYTGRFNGHY
ncbi:anti-sigma regulatory factor (Ser/Thr protein kinase) [Streptosporangium becharense]|uniref:Anti-sigma regulatory factor (Ser/Thr protein kinase) n=1 Tax=Streptosporangium becharense TaxID=1816182 RepID=A0A7W9MIP7_9ACTN|nr:ATP-binding protein [Streptosporangium becharense]MBB2911273.1 anti-sigma regulatory factor (Ser/Thr protein kinase) [Streptosporangium becharense]MBB5821669.1 anti-sigma regulatory factor (Ser/Thr protein kinase) [Streptosporangium becharense]